MTKYDSTNSKISTKKFEPWVPLNELPCRLYCEGIHDDYEGFRILLKGESLTDNMIRISFDGPLIYRYNSECSKSLILFEPGKRALYRTKESDWLDWFSVESCEVYGERDLVHYVLLTVESCIEVISEREPRVEWLGI